MTSIDEQLLWLDIEQPSSDPHRLILTETRQRRIDPVPLDVNPVHQA